MLRRQKRRPAQRGRLYRLLAQPFEAVAPGGPGHFLSPARDPQPLHFFAQSTPKLYLQARLRQIRTGGSQGDRVDCRLLEHVVASTFQTPPCRCLAYDVGWWACSEVCCMSVMATKLRVAASV